MRLILIDFKFNLNLTCSEIKAGYAATASEGQAASCCLHI